jgi:hypothetical protein
MTIGIRKTDFYHGHSSQYVFSSHKIVFAILILCLSVEPSTSTFQYIIGELLTLIT